MHCFHENVYPESKTKQELWRIRNKNSGELETKILAEEEKPQLFARVTGAFQS